MKVLFLVLATMLNLGFSQASIISRPVEYTDGDTKLIGYVAYDDMIKGTQPGVLIIHEWWGLNDYPKRRARELAAMGYVAFCADMYGEGKTTDSWEEAPKLAYPFFGNTELTRERGAVALAELRKQSQVDTSRVAVMGYCFGGRAALELARTGADLDGVISFHGSLGTPHPEEAKNIRGPVLVCHGADDPYVKPDEVAAFRSAMDSAKVNYSFLSYPDAVHAFTNPKAGDDKSKGVAYNADADKASWEEMKKFFAKIFASQK